MAFGPCALYRYLHSSEFLMGRGNYLLNPEKPLGQERWKKLYFLIPHNIKSICKIWFL